MDNIYTYLLVLLDVLIVERYYHLLILIKIVELRKQKYIIM